MLHVHRAESGEALVAALAEVLATPLDDPFTSELVAVPARGVERWVAQRLAGSLGVGAAGDDGICAGVTFPAPGRVLDDALRGAVSEPDAIEAWTAARSTWPLLEVLDACGGEPWCSVLGAHLRAEHGGRRYALARRLAGLFADYGRARPELLRAWAAGGDEAPPDLAWQPELWRRLRARIGLASPAELLAPACARLRAEPACVDLPERLSVLGATRLSAARLQVLAALGTGREVHLWLHHPSPALWEQVGAWARDRPAESRGRADDRSGSVVRHPLLGSLGRDLRELQVLLHEAAPGATDSRHGAAVPAEGLLAWLQEDLRRDRVRPAGERPRLREDDRSVSVHTCHGRERQVEVLREVVLGLLAADPSLEPRDILVMCPDVEAFAPLVAAAFGLDAAGAGEPEQHAPAAAAHPAARLRVRLADRALRQANPLLTLLAALLALAPGRVTATELLDLADSPPVRLRFELDDDDVERLRGWVAASGARWGLDGPHRAGWGLGSLTSGTWRAGLDRLLVGAAMEESAGSGLGTQWLGSGLPLDDVDSGDVDLAGRLAELVDRVQAWVEAAAHPRDVDGWAALLADTVLALGAAPWDASWQEAQLRGELADVVEQAAGHGVVLDLADVVALLDRQLAGRPTRSSFRTGTLTVCTLTPMRSVPHRVVCLLGLDEGAFPRSTTSDGDDLLARDPWVGERDPRSEDRQLLLDAIGAAGQHLIITCTGADERTGARVPPATPLAELLDALDLTAAAPAGQRVRDRVVVRHPLQPFDPRSFSPGWWGEEPFSFDLVALAAARACGAPRVPVGPFLPRPLPGRRLGDTSVALDDVLGVLEHPARAFLRQRLGVRVAREEEEPADATPLQLDGLQVWGLGERLLRAALGGASAQQCRQAELRRGDLPPGALGLRQLDAAIELSERLLRCAEREREHEPRAVDIDVPLPDGRRLEGTVAGVRGDTLLALSCSRVGARARLRAWVQLLALTASSASHTGTPWQAAVIGKARTGGGVLRVGLTPPSPPEAQARLARLVAVAEAGLAAPLPAPVATTEAYAARRHAGLDDTAARGAADKEWSLGDGRERAQAEHELVWGLDADLSVLLTPADPALGSGGPHRLGQLAELLWHPLLVHLTEAQA